jgi:hypothetical protein
MWLLPTIGKLEFQLRNIRSPTDAMGSGGNRATTPPCCLLTVHGNTRPGCYDRSRRELRNKSRFETIQCKLTVNPRTPLPSALLAGCVDTHIFTPGRVARAVMSCTSRRCKIRRTQPCHLPASGFGTTTY